ncbi:enoyl-CoA hydratase/isomerase family protein [Pseudonocardia thermophila]|uniref:enoyl-CoA hydratase/isomerase family protein n=1 Tax=Pseudonocardia thermophila TaxID=1848 RepID=UPI00248E1076|nr:enoyl-CoA hydratase/isomerase family protein [Pseudonocardia thermophila]
MIEGDYRGFVVRIEDPGIAVVTLNEPERLNAMTFAVRRDLVELLTLAQLDDDVRVIVITGTGRGFCAGMYLNPAAQAEEPTLVPGRPNARRVPVNLQAQLRLFSQELIRAVRRSDKITMAAVNGFAVQIGLSLALACDYVIAGRSARLGSATLRMGYQPDENGHWLLVEHLGPKRALDFMLRRRIVDAEEAAALGLITEVVADDELMSRTLELARELAEGPQVAIRLLKRATYNAAHLPFDLAGDDIAVRTAVSDFHPDAEEGRSAWLRREKPNFNGWLDG